MPLKIEKPIIDEKRRVIAVSDIHADLQGFQKLLKKVQFKKEDVLVIVGDMVEKGPNSLDLLQYVMKLKETHDVYVVCGNCDAIALEVLRDERNEDLLRYILLRRHTLVGEMCEKAGIAVTKQLNMLEAKRILRIQFAKELEFISNLAHILKINDYMFAHAAIIPQHIEEMKPSQVMKADAFMNQEYQFDHFVVVGHWPTVLYSQQIPDCNPRIDTTHKIISIDGGNVLKLDGQLNALLIANTKKEEVTYDYVDLLPKAKILNTQEAGDQSFIISYLDNKIKKLREDKEFTYCEHITSGNKMWIPNSYLYEERKGAWETEDITNYQLPLTFGDIVSVTMETNRGCIVKKNGICGWYYGMLEYIHEEL